MTIRTGAVAVVVNPVGASNVAEELRRALAASSVEAEWIETTEDDPGRGQARRAAAAGADLVIACGGDGTVRACAEALAGTTTALAVVPAGTGNLLAHNLGVPLDVEVALDIALTGDRRTIDVGYANDEAFTVMAGAGIDAAVMRDTTRSAKDRLGVLAYVRTALRHLNDRLVNISMSVDGTVEHTGAVATVLAANHGALQAGVELFPDADTGDGRLDYLAVSARGPWAWLRSAFAVLTNRTHSPRVHRWQGERATVSFQLPTPYELDGEERSPVTHLTFAVDRMALTVCVPKEKS